MQLQPSPSSENYQQTGIKQQEPNNTKSSQPIIVPSKF
jgi:hypothetical protein